MELVETDEENMMQVLSTLMKMIGLVIFCVLAIAFGGFIILWVTGLIAIFSAIALVKHFQGAPFKVSIAQPDGTKKVITYRYFKRVA